MTDIKQLRKEFETYAHGQSLHSAFTEMLDWTLLPFKKWDSAAPQKAALQTYQNHPKANNLVKLLELIGELSETFRDPLGELYQQVISSGHNGQYWTPEHVCDMMAAITIGENSKEGQTICDPACGSGRLLLSAAKINRFAKLYGADLDITCCKITLLNMLLNSLQGEIAHMNTLSNVFYIGYKFNTIIVDGYHIPYYTEFTTPELSDIWLKPTDKVSQRKFDVPFEPVRASKPLNGLQGLLFD